VHLTGAFDYPLEPQNKLFFLCLSYLQQPAPISDPWEKYPACYMGFVLIFAGRSRKYQQ